MKRYHEWLKNNMKYVVLFLGGLLLSFYISTNWYQLVLVRGDSMVPAYHNMQFTIIDRRAKDFTYGDIIAFECGGLKSVLIKRIAACPGDQVVIKEGVLYVNDRVSSVYPESVLFEYAGIAENLIQLSDNQYFVIGDNVKESNDSRYQKVGCINAEDILGRTVG